MQEPLRWHWLLNGNTVSVEGSESRNLVSLRYRGYTAFIGLNEEALTEEAESSQSRYYWTMDANTYNDSVGKPLGTDQIVDGIKAIVAEIDRRYAERLALETAKEEAMDILYEVLDGVEQSLQ